MTTRKPMLIGPFSKGLNTYDDPTAIDDRELVEALNFDPGFDGSLRSRPPFTNTEDDFFLGLAGAPRLLGYYYDNNNVPYLIASDGMSSTWRYNGGAWTLITNTFSASDFVQFDGKAWLSSPVGEADPGGYWSVATGFVADADMPRGASIAQYKSRLWVAQGLGGTNPTRLYYSKALGQPSFWASPGFVDVGAGDGESIIKIVPYFDTLLLFRTKSIWSFQYGIDPSTATQGVLVPGVGLQGNRALVAYENYLYFMHDEKAYQFINNRVQQINIKVPFRASNLGSTNDPFHVSLFNNRILYSYYEVIYVYSLRTQTWTTWRSDAWGPMGQVMSSYVSGDTDEAYALPSAPAEAETNYRRNLEQNPRAISTGDLNSFSPRYGWSRGLSSSPTSPADLPFSTVCRITSGETGSLQGRGFDTFGSPDTASPGTTGSWVAGTELTPGKKLRISRYVRMAGYSGRWRIAVRFHDGVGNWVSGKVWGDYFPADSTWTRPFWEGLVPAGAKYLAMYTVNADSADVDTTTWMDMTGLMIDETSSDDATYFDGNFTDDGRKDYGWEGTVNDSASFLHLKRYLPLLRIEDRFNTNKEDMVCQIQTKNYSFEVPGSYKVLFWWGLDAIFRTNVTAQVSPVVFNSVAMWGQVREAGHTWGGLFTAGRTWRFPVADGENGVISEVVTAAGPARKFVKFFKKLRFRQLFFRIRFNTDGSDATAPVQIFTISTYMAEKETVSKQVT